MHNRKFAQLHAQHTVIGVQLASTKEALLHTKQQLMETTGGLAEATNQIGITMCGNVSAMWGACSVHCEMYMQAASPMCVARGSSNVDKLPQSQRQHKDGAWLPLLLLPLP